MELAGSVTILGNDVPLSELKADVQSAKDKGLSQRWAFCPETVEALIAAVESLTAEKEREIALQWIKGEPPYPYGDEWFIARTIHRERVVLRSLPKEYSYDYTTADGTYMKRENITDWMQFPDSQYKSFALTAAEASLAQAQGELAEAPNCESCEHDRPAMLQENEELRSSLAQAREEIAAQEDKHGEELRRWQDAIRGAVIKASGAPDYAIDGAGCDSGDPLDFTLTEITQGFVFLKEAAESSLAQAREEIALLRIQKGQLEDREEAAEQREKGLREALVDMFDPLQHRVACQKRLMDKCMCAACIAERAKAALRTALLDPETIKAEVATERAALAAASKGEAAGAP